MINLAALAAAGGWRTSLDPAAEGDPVDKAWLRRIDGRSGHVYVHGPAMLGVFVGGSRAARRIEALGGMQPHQRGDREFSYTFQPCRLDEVCWAIAGRRVRVAPASAANHLRAHRFRSAG